VDLLTVLDMVVAGSGDRVLIGGRVDGLTARDIRDRAIVGGQLVRDAGAEILIYLGSNSAAFPIALFSATIAHVPFLPVNYRLGNDQLREILGRYQSGVLVADDPQRAARFAPHLKIKTAADILDSAASGGPDPTPPARDSIAVLLMTSGTTATPKSAVLRHSHLTSYVIGATEFLSASVDDAAIVSVPPYHIAAVANLLSNLYAGRRIVYLDQFSPEEWLRLVDTEHITNAMVVPTMLARIVSHLEQTRASAPSSLRSLSYGGAKVGVEVISRALQLFPETGFVNAYGLTETSSSVAVLGPVDHRLAAESDDPAVRARLGSAGRALPEVAIEVRDPDGAVCPPGVEGEILVKGAQISGEYLEAAPRPGGDGWFHTRDAGYLDDNGYLFVRGRIDDTIIRGGENIAPATIEETVDTHPDVKDCAVAGVPDSEWGQLIAAFVVIKSGHSCTAEDVRDFVRRRLRRSMTPDIVVFVDELPTTPTGKVLRRDLVTSLTAGRM
jgi:acyl-CoA synthetase (AMP-forming)/AMP-acid ligase II